MFITKNSTLIFGGTGAVGMCLSMTHFPPKPSPVSSPSAAALSSRTSASLISVRSVQVVFCTLGINLTSAPSREAFKRIDQQYVLDSARHVCENAPKDPQTGCSKAHFLYCSAIGANPNFFFFGTRTKGETEQALTEVGFERMSILQPAILMVVEPPESVTIVEWAATRLVPLVKLVAEKSTTVSMATVAKCMRLVGTSDSVGVARTAPKKVEIHPVSKTTVAYYSNAKIHDIVNNART
ncbi:hypothetical protein BG006_007496 [Podila minutissima]|uniref:Uncharacterized protein n=1 Tax=Podila minutissima TaxID=64525 RepID=A0A9P5SLF1_9FUNG|nr:hypothetical protein BG006_007496 [Podila minutissima]